MDSLTARTCVVDGCENKHLARGFCDKHYRRFRRKNPDKLNPPKVKGFCSVEGCKNLHRAKGFCGVHYSRMRTHGTLETAIIVGDDEKRFRSKIDENGPFIESLGTRCWLWLGTLDPDGYGHIAIKKKQWIAHRYSYFLAFDVELDGLILRHQCDNPRCVNPEHLLSGTHADNVADRVARKRSANSTGSGAPWARLTENDVREIKTLLENGSRAPQICKRYNVNVHAIYGIKYGRSWKHVK